MRLSQIVKLLDTRFNKKWGNKEEKGKKERKKKIPETHRNYKDDTTNTTGKTSTRRILMIPRKAIIDDQSGSHERPNDKRALELLDGSCGPPCSPVVTFFSVVRIVLSRSFQWYWWCRYRSFVCLQCHFLFFFVCFFLFSPCNLWRDRRWKKVKIK